MPSPDAARSVIEPDALEALVSACETGATACSGRRSATARSSTTTSRSATSCPLGWTDEQDAGQLPARAARRRGALRLRGRPALVEAVPASRRASASGRRGATSDGALEVEDGAAAAERVRVPRRPLLRAARDRDPGPRLPRRPLRRAATTPPAARTRSSSPSTAASPAAPASASRWAPARRRRPATTSRSPSSSTASTASSSRSGSERGAEVLARAAATAGRRGGPRTRPSARSRGAAARMGRTLDTDDLRDLLARNLEHPRWDDVAERCLTCGNCTHGLPDLLLHDASRTRPTSPASDGRALARRWDSCFTVDYSLHPRRQRPAVGRVALPPVADPQARHLARPVRHVRLRRLRPLHHLVPGRHRHHRGGCAAIRATDGRRDDADA